MVGRVKRKNNKEPPAQIRTSSAKSLWLICSCAIAVLGLALLLYVNLPHDEIAPAKTQVRMAAVAPPAQAEQVKREDTEVLLAFNSGNYFKALATLEQKLRQQGLPSAQRRWLQTQLPTALTAAGRLHVDLGDCDTGIEHLARAERLRHNALNLRGLAWCHYRKREFRTASPYFDAYLQERRNDIEMLLLYSDMLAEQEEYKLALAFLAKIDRVGFSPEQQQRLRVQEQKLQAQERHASEQQAVMETNSFKITYQRQLHDELSVEIAATLDTALHYYVDHYGFAYPERKIAVDVYAVELFRELMAAQPHWVEGYFDGRIRIPVAVANFSLSKLRRTLRHELVHALLAQRSGFRRLPSWFDEGLAQYLACLDNCTAFSFPADGELLPAKVLRGSFLTLAQVQAQRAYHHSLFLITLLENERRATSELKTIIAAISPQQGVSSDALLEVVAKNFADFHRHASISWKNSQRHASLQ